MKKPIFVAIKMKDAVDPRMGWAHSHHFRESDNYLLVSTSFKKHNDNMMTLRIGGSTTSITTPGYKHMQPTSRMSNDPRGYGYDLIEVGHSYALSDVAPQTIVELRSNGRAEILFACNVDEMAEALKQAKAAEDGTQPLPGKRTTKKMPQQELRK